ncbi:hypothetical protein PVAND_003297 [Polypedilum vanderplanki]|uniref:Uncharacterized protein n=1 Tax=Polypedilum vanderplanki TaxID=319348 RepID=A0A9J6BTL9_POLVA|nr:hypothetical protein PVAND_003297 [Polypedilum vanderplanki]
MENQQEKEIAVETGKQQNHVDIFEAKKKAINESIKKLNEVVKGLNKFCENANDFMNSLQALEKFAMPEVIGNKTNIKVPKKPIYDNTGYLIETLNTFNEIFSSYADRIRTETINEFDNFIMQVVSPSHEELKGVYDHNKNIIEEFRNGFYSLMNHFYVLGAELLEKFLICGECNTPMGFTHQLDCSIKQDKVFKWKKTNFDDKFITFDMKFSFGELFNPKKKKEILKLIQMTINKQGQIGSSPKTSLPIDLKSSWPEKWTRNNQIFQSQANNENSMSDHPTTFNATVWTQLK